MDIKMESDRDYGMDMRRDRSRSPFHGDAVRDGDRSQDNRNFDREFDRRDSRGVGGRSRSRDRIGRDRSNPRGKRAFISNLPYEFSWQELKDLFRREVGDVAFAEILKDDTDRPSGCGVVEFETVDALKRAIDKMHKFDLRNRKLIVKEDSEIERQKYARFLKPSGGMGGGPPRGPPRDMGPPQGPVGPGGRGGSGKWNETYGLSPQFLESLNIGPPLLNRIFVGNLDYKVDKRKLKEVFRMAGKMFVCEVALDKDGKSRGFGIVEYDHPVEAVQAISMFNNRPLYERKMSVRMDRMDPLQDVNVRLPDGLHSMGMGLGPGGRPLRDVAHNLPNSPGGNQPVMPPPPPVQPVMGGGAPIGGMNVGGGGGMNMVGSNMGGPADMMMGGNMGNVPSMNRGMGGGMNPMGGSGGGSGGFGGSNQFGDGFGSNMGGGFDSMNRNHGGGGGGGSFNSDRGDFRGSSDFSNGPGRNMGGGGGGGTGVSGGGPVGGGSSNDRGSGPVSGGNGSDTVIIRNLSPTVTWQMLRDKFDEVGPVKFAELRGKDMGLVRFGSDWDAERAVRLLDRSRFDGRTIEVCLY